MIRFICCIILAICSIGHASSGDIVSMKGMMDGRQQHSSLYESDCTSCHDNNPQKNVTDTACISCHGEIQDIKLDKSKLPIPEANPHSSVHFADGASCLACHSEHKQKAPICTDCHTSWFKKR